MQLEFTPPPQPDRIESLINAINMEHLWTLRLLDGKDLSKHIDDVINLEKQRNYSAMVERLERMIDVTHTLEQYDPREPQMYYASKAASIYIKLGRPDDAIRVLRRWLRAWPPERATTQVRGREQLIARLAHLEAEQAGL